MTKEEIETLRQLEVLRREALDSAMPGNRHIIVAGVAVRDDVIDKSQALAAMLHAVLAANSGAIVNEAIEALKPIVQKAVESA